MFTKRDWLVIAIYVSMLLLTAIIPVVLHFSLEIDIIDAAIYTNIVLFIAAVIIILYIIRNDLKKERKRHPMTTGQIIGWTALGILLAWVVQALSVTFEINVLGIEPKSENTDAIVSFSRMNPFFIFVPAITAPIIEEIVFRKILFGSLAKRTNIYFAAIISAVIFALLHTDFSHLLIYTAVGLVFSYIYVKTKRIIVPIFVHMGMNTLAVLLQLNIDPEQLEKIQQDVMTIIFGG